MKIKYRLIASMIWAIMLISCNPVAAPGNPVVVQPARAPPPPGTDLHSLAVTHRYPHPLANGYTGTNLYLYSPGRTVRPHP
jgi:hypothetical protein